MTSPNPHTPSDAETIVALNAYVIGVPNATDSPDAWDRARLDKMRRALTAAAEQRRLDADARADDALKTERRPKFWSCEYENEDCSCAAEWVIHWSCGHVDNLCSGHARDAYGMHLPWYTSGDLRCSVLDGPHDRAVRVTLDRIERIGATAASAPNAELAQALRFLDAAWNNPGPAPAAHERERSRLADRWPRLKLAIERLLEAAS